MFLPAHRRFFITGCQRSGTTLLRLVMECHPEVFCFDETDSYRVLASAPSEPETSRRLVGFKIPRWAEQLDSRVLCDFGLPHRAQQIYHGQKILFLVRDYRDTISSMLKLRSQRSWLEEWAEPIIKTHLERDRRFAETWARQFALCDAAPNRLIGIGALYWAYKNAAFLRYKERGYPVLAVSYERLVMRPEDELRRVCAFMGIEFTDELLHHPYHSHREIFENGLAIGDTDPNRFIDTASVGQWPRFLDGSDVRLAQEIVGRLPGLIAPYFA